MDGGASIAVVLIAASLAVFTLVDKLTLGNLSKATHKMNS